MFTLRLAARMLTLVANSWLRRRNPCPERLKGGDACQSDGDSSPPCTHADEVERDRCHDLLECNPGKSSIASMLHLAPAYALRHGTFNTSPMGIERLKRWTRLTISRCLHHQIGISVRFREKYTLGLINIKIILMAVFSTNKK